MRSAAPCGRTERVTAPTGSAVRSLKSLTSSPSSAQVMIRSVALCERSGRCFLACRVRSVRRRTSRAPATSEAGLPSQASRRLRVVCPVGEGLRPLLRRFVLLQPFPLAVVISLGPSSISRLRAGLVARGASRGLPGAQAWDSCRWPPVSSTNMPQQALSAMARPLREWRVQLPLKQLLPAGGSLPVPNHIEVHRPRQV